MIAVLQRVNRAEVFANGEFSGKCEKGLLILLGVMDTDDAQDAILLADKISRMRIFSDNNGKMNLSVTDVGGGALIVSNFTLGADYSHGNRPNYLMSAKPDMAIPLYEMFISLMRERIFEVQSGVFGADMQIRCECDGPVTIIVDSAKLVHKGKGNPNGKYIKCNNKENENGNTKCSVSTCTVAQETTDGNRRSVRGENT